MIIIWILLLLFSFTLQDFNLTLYNFPGWNQARQILQNLGYFHRPLATLIFIILCFCFFLIYLRQVKLHWRTPANRQSLILFLFFVLTGVLAYPFLSYDLFNYIFNAKMVLVYHANPHLQTAIQFSSDLWTRFMHNLHTPAPYAYGWTLLSLIPGSATLSNNFTLSFWLMKLFIAGFFFLQLYVLKRLQTQIFPQQSWRWWLFSLNPLVLIETLIVGHNDVVMMFLALTSYWFLLKSKKLFDQPWFWAIVILLLSASIKYASIVLIPLYILPQKLKKIDIASFASLLLLALMFTRPGQLHSWYLIWAFSFAVLSRSRWLISFLIALSFGALLRYAPFLYYGHWDPPVYFLRNLIWLISLIFTPFIYKLTEGDSQLHV